MNFDFPKLLNSAVEGFVFFTNRYLEAVYLLLRYPMRGAHYLSYRNLKKPDASISPYVFILINLIIGFIAIAITGPLIFTNLKAISRSANALIGIIENSDFNFLPLILRSLVILISVDLLLRISSMVVRHRRQREFARYSILFALGLQPLAVVLGIIYLMQYDLLNTHHGTLVIGSTAALLLLLALPAIALTARTLKIGRKRQPNPSHIAAGIGLTAALVILALYAEAGALVWWDFAGPPTRINISDLHCTIDKDGSLEVLAVIENKTQNRVVLPSQDLLHVYSGDQDVKMDTFETSLGKNAPLLIFENGKPIWMKATGAVAIQPTQTGSGQPCVVELLNGNFIRGEQTDYWRSQ